MEEPMDSIVEERKAYMVSSIDGDNKTIVRTAHFLKPTLLNGQPPPLSSMSLPIISEPSQWPLKVNFANWPYPSNEWKQWVDQMEGQHGGTWKKVGIFDAVKASATFQIVKDSNLMLELAQRWSPETNTFIFSWGETTVTLEDVMVIGDYSVLGYPVSRPLETEEMINTEEKLKKDRSVLSGGKSKKASFGQWMKRFKASGSEIEHEAFIAYWLSRFVFTKRSVIPESVLRVAVHLARGTRIALAPAVLASIYRDLSVMKKHIICLVRRDIEMDNEGQCMLTVWAPFALVQLWLWERFPMLRPKCSMIRAGEPRIARWFKQKTPKIKNIHSALESCDGGEFQWRPYARPVLNLVLHPFYGENEKWILLRDEADQDLISFAKFLVPCELVGLDGCIEQYLPHRVAMQFGMDQDLPGSVVRYNSGAEIVRSSYDEMSILNKRLYIPAGVSNAAMTERYVNWWKKMKLDWKDGVKVVGLPEGIPESLRELFQHVCNNKKMNSSDPSVPPCFEPKGINLGSESSNEDNMTIRELLSSSSQRRKVVVVDFRGDASTSRARSSSEDDSTRRKGNPPEEEALECSLQNETAIGVLKGPDGVLDSLRVLFQHLPDRHKTDSVSPTFPPGFEPEGINVESYLSAEEKVTIEELTSDAKKHKIDKVNCCGDASNSCRWSSSPDDSTRKTLEEEALDCTRQNEPAVEMLEEPEEVGDHQGDMGDVNCNTVGERSDISVALMQQDSFIARVRILLKNRKRRGLDESRVHK